MDSSVTSRTREGYMSNGLRSRPICVRCLMFVVAIQAMTPDARDLSSAALFKLLDVSSLVTLAAADSYVPASDLGRAGGDSLPTRTDDQGEQSEEVCLPGRMPDPVLS